MACFPGNQSKLELFCFFQLQSLRHSWRTRRRRRIVEQGNVPESRSEKQRVKTTNWPFSSSLQFLHGLLEEQVSDDRWLAVRHTILVQYVQPRQSEVARRTTQSARGSVLQKRMERYFSCLGCCIVSVSFWDRTDKRNFQSRRKWRWCSWRESYTRKRKKKSGRDNS